MENLKYINNNCDRGYWVYTPSVISPGVPGKFELKDRVWVSVAQHGTLAEAKIAAIKVRDKYLKKNKVEFLLTSHGLKNKKVRNAGNNTSGVTGVRVISLRGHDHWSCTYVKEDGKKSSKTYSIARYGNKEAFQMACKARHDSMGTLNVINMKLLPCKPSVPYEKV